MRSRTAAPGDLAIVASWIGSQRECELWAGPRVAFPLELSALPEQIEMAHAINVALDDEQGLAAFGQALPRGPGRAHLGRIIVRPSARRRGLGRALVQTLLARVEAAGLTLVTLNVCRDNAAAIMLYSGLGFRQAEPLPEDPLPTGVWFMRRDVSLSSEERGVQ